MNASQRKIKSISSLIMFVVAGIVQAKMGSVIDSQNTLEYGFFVVLLPALIFLVATWGMWTGFLLSKKK